MITHYQFYLWIWSTLFCTDWEIKCHELHVNLFKHEISVVHTLHFVKIPIRRLGVNPGVTVTAPLMYIVSDYIPCASCQVQCIVNSYTQTWCQPWGYSNCYGVHFLYVINNIKGNFSHEYIFWTNKDHMYMLGQKICVFTVRRLTLIIGPDPKLFHGTFTVNVVIFAGGKFRENVDKTFRVGVIFPIPPIFP